MKPVQYHSAAMLADAKKMTPTQIAKFLDDYRQMTAPKEKSILISLRVPAPLLRAFRNKAAQEGIPYQTKIKKLMEENIGAWHDN